MEVSFCWSWSHVWCFFAAKRDEHTKRFNENGVLKTESNSASNRIESNSIFEHTHYSKSKGINKSLLLRTTSVSSGGGAFRKTACYLYEQKLDNKKILKAAIEESKSRTGTARRSKKNKGEKGRMAHHLCNVYISRVACSIS